MQLIWENIRLSCKECDHIIITAKVALSCDEILSLKKLFTAKYQYFEKQKFLTEEKYFSVIINYI